MFEYDPATRRDRSAHDGPIDRLLACHRALPPDPELAWAHRQPGLPTIDLASIREWLANHFLGAAEVLADGDQPCLLSWTFESGELRPLDAEDAAGEGDDAVA